VVGIGIGVFVDTSTSVVVDGAGTLVDQTAVWWDHGVDLQLITYVIMVAVGAAAIGVGAYLNSWLDRPIELGCVWAGRLILSLGVLLDLPAWSTTISVSGISTWHDVGIGVFLAPAAVLGLIASIAGLWAESHAGQALSHSS
jgi:hypothetical protein